MKNYKKIVEILEKHLDDEGIFFGEIASEICDLFSVSNCECKNLPEGEIAISSKALTDPNWKS
jgi:hypothetical protein